MTLTWFEDKFINSSYCKLYSLFTPLMKRHS